MKRKILFIFGTRPEAIKLAPVIKKFREDDTFITKVCVTGQHREMLDQVLEVFEIRPDWDLDIMKDNQDLFDISSSVLLKIKDVLEKCVPDLVIVHGDTTTSMISALACFYMHIQVGHIEAGLRTYDINAPWPEEINRQITSRISTFHFAPTESAKQNLLDEGIKEEKIIVTGNTVIDTLFEAIKIIKEKPPLIPELMKADILNSKCGIVLITSHRRENFGEGFESICSAIVRLARKFNGVHFVYPLHLNPNIGKKAFQLLGSGKIPNIHLIKHLGYLPFVALMNRAQIILTDSGGVQEEAPNLGKPVLVTRKSTERPEGLTSGIVKIVGTNEELIVDEISLLLTNEEYYGSRSISVNPYGDGHASKRIHKFIRDHFGSFS